MKYQYKGKQQDLTPSLIKEVPKRFKTLERLVGDNGSLNVELTREPHHKKGLVYWVDINLNVIGKAFKATAKSDSPLTAIDEAKGKILAEYKKYHQKQIGLNRRLSRKLKHSTES